MRLFDIDTWGEAFHSVRTNRKRTLATAFGVFYGILMLIILLSVGQGFSNAIKKNLGGLAENSSFLATSGTTKPYKGFQKGRRWTLKPAELDQLRKRFPEITAIAPMAQGDWRSSVRYGTKIKNAPLYAAPPTYNKIVYCKLLAGRLLNEQDELDRNRYCTVGKAICEQLFGSHQEAIGKTLRVGNTYYTVVGVTQSISEAININGREDDKVRIPYALLTSDNGGEEIDAFSYTLATNISDTKAVNNRIKSYLRATHDVHPADDGAIISFDVSEMFQFINKILFGVNIFIWFVGIGTVLSGIIGISNIMLVSIKERTREIGVRRALGAKPRDVIMLVMIESLMISLVSGLLGLIAGVGLMSIVDKTIPPDAAMFYQDAVVSFWGGIGALALVVASGFLGGLLPANRALNIKAIEAIREE